MSRSFVALVCWSLSAGALAADTWTTPFPGVSQLKRVTSTPWEIFALKVDLCARGVAMRATQESEKKRTTSSFRSLVSAKAAINGDFFSYADYYPSSMAIGQGTQWHGDDKSHGFIAFGPDQTDISVPSVVLAQAESWMKQAVGGYPLLVDNGAAITSFTASHCAQRHPRTAVGLSKDHQTLFLVVVDGRTTISLGMTCKELASLMLELGAWRSLNLDGGGSSTLSITGKGAVNNPSDGQERVVSNHLALFADGTGAPGSCDLWMDEAIVDGAMLGGGNTSDMNGDGKADLCARAAAGWRCYPSNGSGFGAGVTTTALSDSSGWNDERNFATIRMGDVTGDGKADVCARADTKVQCWPSKGTSWGAAFDGPGLSDASGWSAPEFYTTLRLADVTGDGKDDLCGRAAAGLRCWPSTGSAFGAAINGPAWSDADGWNAPNRYGTLRTGDVNGDGRQDVCARAKTGMVCAISSGSGFPTSVSGPAWSDTAGFDDVKYWSTIRLVDVNGDGRADLCARTAAGVECALSTGTAFGAVVAGPTLSDASGWGDLDNATTIRFGDLDGDGDQDLCARANAGIRCWPWTGAGFGAQIVGPAWNDAGGWDDFRLYSTFHMGDLNGDGKADLCGRAADGVRCVKSTGTGFGAEIATAMLSDASGWAGAPYYPTLRFAGPACGAKVEVCNGEDDDCDGVVDDGNPGGGAACTGQGVGVCAAGKTVCQAGAIVCAATGVPSPEQCNGKDDDCDGVVDQGGPGGGQPCDSGALGVCQAGTTACAAGAITCVPNTKPTDDVCNGVDDDCDGETDEAFTSEPTTCGGPGCEGQGATVCVAGAVESTCVPADGAACGPGVSCFTGGVCALGVCTGAAPIPGACEDGNPCTTDGCDAAQGCVHGPAAGACDDGNPCTSGEACAAGGCAGGVLVSCDDGNPCTKDGCFADVGCQSTPTLAPCEDDDPCTATSCQGGACVVTGVTPGCCDSDADCDGGEVCDGGFCRAAPCADCGDQPRGGDVGGGSGDAGTVGDVGPTSDVGGTPGAGVELEPAGEVESGSDDTLPGDTAGASGDAQIGPVAPGVDTGGCSAAGASSTWGWTLLLAAALLRRRFAR